MLKQRPGPRMTRIWLLLICVVILSLPSSVMAIGPLFGKSDPLGPQTGADARASAIESIPRHLLSPEARAKVDSVLANTAMFRRMPVRVVPCDPDMYLFLVRHPDVVVNIWEVLKMSNLAMEQTGPACYAMVDNAGTEGTIEFLYQSPDTHILYSEGHYKGPLIRKPVTGRSIIILKTAYIREPNGRHYITSRLDAFVQIDHEGLELLAKTIHPLLGKVADMNFTQTIAFVGSLSKTAEVDPKGMRRLAGQLKKVSTEVATQFAEISDKTAMKAAQNSVPASQEVSSVARRPDSTRTR